MPNDANQHAFVNVAYANAPASASGEPCQTFAGGFPPHMPAQLMARLTGQSHAPGCEPRNQRLVAFGLLGPDATSVTYRTAHGTATTRPRGPDGAYLIIEPVDPAICGSQCDYSSGGAATAMRLPIGLIARITCRDAPTCYGPPLTNSGLTLRRFDHCRDVGYVAPYHPAVTEADVASPVDVQPMPARYYCMPKGSSESNRLPIPCEGRVPKGYFRLTDQGPQLMVYISWIAREPVTNVNDSTYSIQVTNPPRCGGSRRQHHAEPHPCRQSYHPRRRGLEPLPRHLPGHGRLRAEPWPGRRSRHGPAGAGRPGHISRRAVLDRGAMIRSTRAFNSTGAGLLPTPLERNTGDRKPLQIVLRRGGLHIHPRNTMTSKPRIDLVRHGSCR